MQNAWQRQSESGLACLAALPFTHLYFDEVFMIDPKQGPLFRTRRNAELSARPEKRASADTTPETKGAGRRPSTSKRQFSFVGN
jgi:hypothetical protein